MATGCCALKDRALGRPSDDGLLANRSPSRTSDRFAVASRSLPFHLTVDADRKRYDSPSDWGLDTSSRSTCIAARRNDHRGASAVVSDGVVGRFAVIGTIGGELADRTVDLVQ